MADSASIPIDVIRALKTANLFEMFAALPPSHRREYVKWIEDAKKPYTRAVRIAKTCKMLTKGKGGRAKK